MLFAYTAHAGIADDILAVIMAGVALWSNVFGNPAGDKAW